MNGSIEENGVDEDVVKNEENGESDTDVTEMKTVHENSESEDVKTEKNEKLDNESMSDTETEHDKTVVKDERDLSEDDIEREIKKELKEAVEIRVPKLVTKNDVNDTKWKTPKSGEKSKKRPDTPPLQKLMRQDFSPLKLDNLLSPSPPKRFKESSSHNEGFTSKLASVIIPSTSTNLPPKTASHPKQLLSHSIANLRTSSLKSSHLLKSSFTPSSLFASGYGLNHTSTESAEDDQPLDLSKKSGSSSSKEVKSSPLKKSSKHESPGKHENGLSSTSLQSLQQKFGGDFHLRGLRKPLNYMLYGPEIPALHQALLNSASMALPHYALPMTNGQPKHLGERIHHSRHQSMTMSSHSVKSRSEDSVKSIKREEPSDKVKRELADKSDIENEPEITVDEKQGDNYTNHLCTCGKWFDGLYSLSLHLQETGHLPARNKSVSLLEYPKLVRGQDMWLNQESEQTRRILRCIQCGESFKTLPMLTVHMMKTQHYTKIVSSEHARRTHKCSAYCDKEQDKECVFKCKVCQESFPDMEGLANHMIMSGHHKKQSSRTSQSFGDVQFKKRKRYSFEESLNPYGNPNMAALFDYKRQLASGSVSPDIPVDDVDDSRISCENCGRRIETKLFVDHVRTCLGQKLKEDVARMEKENAKKLERELSGSKGDFKEEKESVNSPVKKRKFSESLSKDEEKDKELLKKIKSEVDNESTSNDKDIDDNDEKHDSDTGRNSVSDRKDVNESDKSIKHDSDSDELELGEIRDKSKSILKEIQTLVESKNSRHVRQNHVKAEISSAEQTESENGEDGNGIKRFLGKKLDIIDPDNVKEETSEGSALSAMESFIKKSFSNKFDYKKGNIIISPKSSSDATIHTRPLNSAMNFENADYLNRYKHFYASLNLNLNNGNGFKKGLDDRDDEKSERGSHDNIKREIRSRIVRSKDRSEKLESPTSTSSNEGKEDGRSSVKSGASDSSSQLDKNENLENKYLSLDGENDGDSKQSKEKSSALDNLSSFVYGQNLTSEHPLDSLQRLITKSDIPKLIGSATSRGFRYLPPHLQLHQSSLDLSLPLNLALKSQNGESDDDDSKSRQDDDSLSDFEAVGSPTNSDGEQMEYRCAACSRKFASKGSYRYHLSRCHLSSVKRYGIKEAFNMSPYVYLPLDHTAKFSKYYEMAKELANKAKENRTK
ncbi:Malpighian tubule stellate cell differentiation [Mactra antiquata]